MKTLLTLILTGVSLAMTAGIAAAQTPTLPRSRAGVVLKVSTLGAGVDVAVPISGRVNLRGGFATFGLGRTFDQDGLLLDARLQLRSVATHLDWFPFGGGFHLSPGVMLYNGNGLSAKATVAGGEDFSLGDEDLISNPANPVTGTASVLFRKVAPSLLLGWGNIVPRGSRRWSIPVELGVIFSRAPIATLSLGGSACARNGGNCRNIASDSTLQAEMKQQVAQMNEDISVLKILPVLSFGFSVKF